MSDEIIKNSRRKNRLAIRSKYVPEWIRLGKEPVVSEGNPSDAMFLTSNKSTSMKPNVISNKEQVNKLPKDEKTFEIPLPKQTKVSVGQNKNWLDFEVNQNASADILYDEIPDPPSSDTEDISEISDDQILQPGEYGVLVKNFVVFKTFLLKEAEAMIEKILFDQLPQFSQISIDDIALHMRLPLKVGVLAILE